MARISLDGQTVMPVAVMPDLLIVVVASWIALAGDPAIVDRCVLDALGADESLDPLAFAKLYLSEHEGYWGAPFVLPQGACMVDGQTGRATLLMPKQLIDAPCDGAACSCLECAAIGELDASELAAEAGLRARWVSPGGEC